MGKTYVVRRAAMTAAVNVTNAVNVVLNGTATSQILSPGGMITKLRWSIANSIQQIADAGVVIGLKISGGGVQGTHEFTLGGLSNGTTSTSDRRAQTGERDVQIALVANNQEIVVEAFANGVDVGTPEIQVELEITS